MQERAMAAWAAGVVLVFEVFFVIFRFAPWRNADHSQSCGCKVGARLGERRIGKWRGAQVIVGEAVMDYVLQRGEWGGCAGCRGVLRGEISRDVRKIIFSGIRGFFASARGVKTLLC